MALLKFIQQLMVSLGNEEQLMHGTYIDADVNLERFKSVLLTEYKSKDSLNQIEHSQLMTFFSSLILIYQQKNTDILTEMCKYLNTHITNSLPSSSQPSRQHSEVDHQNVVDMNQSNNHYQEADDSQVFPVRQFNSSDQKSMDQKDSEQSSSRPSFGNAYVNNFIRDEQNNNSQKKLKQELLELSKQSLQKDM